MCPQAIIPSDANSDTTNPIASAPSFARAGQAANQAAATLAFAEYRANRPAQTLRAQQGDLTNFATFLVRVGISDAPTGEKGGKVGEVALLGAQRLCRPIGAIL